MYQVDMNAGFPLVGGLRVIPSPFSKKWLVPPFYPTVLPQKCSFCNFHAVFDHFAQNVPSGGTFRTKMKNPVVLFSTFEGK